MPAYQPPGGRYAPGYPPPRDMPAPPYPPYQDPIRTYWPDSGPMQAYQPGISGPMQAYQPDMSGPMRAYQADMAAPMTAYQTPPGGRPARSARSSTGLLSEFPISEPIRTYEPPVDRPVARRAPQRSSAGGKEILGWLPFGNRLVLMPKDLVDDEEELREHRDISDGWLRPAVFGAMDGLVTNVSLIAGVGAGAGGGARGMIVLTGIAGLIAGAFSMATGEYISVSSQNELTQAEVELERKQHARDPEGKLRRLAHLFVEKGVSPNLAEAVVRQISADPERAVAAHVREELGIDPDDLPSPRTAAIASLASFTVGALIPLTPFLVGYPVLKVALVLSGAAAFIGGAAVAKLTGRSMFLGGLRQFTAAALGTGAAFFIGHAIGGHIS
jgi:VIT1/CCC1 family predicted Fe2+/Mn2+ transporter